MSLWFAKTYPPILLRSRVVPVMQPAKPPASHDSSAGSLRSRGKATAGSLLFQRVVRAVLVVIGNVLSQQSAKVTLVEDDGVIEQFAPHASDPALCGAVLPRASQSRPGWALADAFTVVSTRSLKIESRSKIR